MNFRVRVEQSLSAPHRLDNGVPQAFPLGSTLFPIAINGIFEGVGTSVWKWWYVDDLALFYSTKATAMIKCEMQGTIDTLFENANNISQTHFFFLDRKVDLCPFLSKARRELGPDINHKRCLGKL